MHFDHCEKRIKVNKNYINLKLSHTTDWLTESKFRTNKKQVIYKNRVNGKLKNDSKRFEISTLLSCEIVNKGIQSSRGKFKTI